MNTRSSTLNPHDEALRLAPLPLAGQRPGLDRRRERWVLVAMCMALIAVVASVSGLNVAQQRLAIDLGATQGQLLWVINGYTIALAALLLPIGAIGDRWGRRTVLQAGLAVFVAANLASAFASGVTMLLVTRIVAGVAAAAIMPATLSIITSTFAEEDRDRAVGVWAGFAGAGGVLGLFASAVVVDHLSWPWVFGLPIGLAVAAFAATVMVVPNSRGDEAGGYDVAGALLSTVAIGGLVLGVQEGPERGWSAPLTLVGLVAGAAALAAFVVVELRRRHPLLPVRIFAKRAVSAGSVSLLLLFAIIFGMFLLVVQYLQSVLGYRAVSAAVGLLPMAAVMLPLSALAPRIVRRVGFRWMFAAGSFVTAAGLVVLAVQGSVSGGYLSALPGLLVVSVGAGLMMTPATTAITTGLPVSEQGVASALNDTVREFGGALGIALFGSLTANGYRDGIAKVLPMIPGPAREVVRQGIGGAIYVADQAGPQGAPLVAIARESFVDGWRVAMWVAAALAAVAGIVLAVLTPRRAAAASDAAQA